MLTPRSEITIGNYIFPFCVNASAESSWDTLADTCSIVIPKNLRLNGSIAQGDSLFKRGDKVVFKAGFGSELREIFTGYVSQPIKPKVTIEFECEDELWQLKQSNITASYKSVTLEQLLADHCPIPFETLDRSLGQFRISNANLAQVLEELNDTYGIYSWIRGGKLYSGRAYVASLQKEATFGLGYNILDDSGLEFQRKEDVRIKVKAISMLPNNQKIEVELGDPDGDQRTLHYYDISEAELKIRAEQEIDELKYTGYKGSFTALGDPGVNHGDICNLLDKFNEGRDGKFLIRKVTTTIGMNGFEQDIELDRRIG